MGKDWIAIENGQCYPCAAPREWDLLETPYHFYRFLTEVENALKQATTIQQCECLPALRCLVRKLIVNAYWLRSFSEGTNSPSHPKINFPSALSPSKQSQGSDFINLYDEAGYPLTVQIETLAPGRVSTIHCHGTWGIVAVLQGQEKNTLWKRQPEPSLPDKIVCVADMTLKYGDIISFMPTAIHSIESVGVEPLVTFNLYGETDHKQRFEFDSITHQAKHY
ncbi:MAG: cupin [Cyanobacteria bacterium P01_D01_bin.105]